jgi:hypothetical protein
VKLTLVLPLFAVAAQLLFDTTDYPMTILEFQIFTHFRDTIIPVFALRSSVAIFAVNLQSVFTATVFEKATLALPLFALAA